MGPKLPNAPSNGLSVSSSPLPVVHGLLKAQLDKAQAAFEIADLVGKYEVWSDMDSLCDQMCGGKCHCRENAQELRDAYGRYHEANGRLGPYASPH